MTDPDKMLPGSPRIEIDLAKIYRNTCRLNRMFLARGISMMGVTKGFLGSPRVAAAMTAAGLEYLADSRIENIKKMRDAGIKNTLVLIRTPSMSNLKQVVKYADISLSKFTKDHLNGFNLRLARELAFRSDISVEKKLGRKL